MSLGVLLDILQCPFVAMNLILLLLCVSLAVFVVGSPVLTCYSYTCTTITLLQYLIGLRATTLSIKVLSSACDILAHYTLYTPLRIWITFHGADRKKISSVFGLELLGPLVEDFQLLLLCSFFFEGKMDFET